MATAGGCLPNLPELKTDLCTPTYGFNAAGKHVLEGKDEIKKRGLRLTDIADALALTFAAPVAPRSTSLSRRSSAIADYDRWLQARPSRMAIPQTMTCLSIFEATPSSAMIHWRGWIDGRDSLHPDYEARQANGCPLID